MKLNRSQRRAAGRQTNVTRPELEFSCPFCGLAAGASKDWRLRFHARPMCARFNQAKVEELSASTVAAHDATD